MAHTHSMLDTQVYKHTLRISSTYYYYYYYYYFPPTAAMVARTQLILLST